MKLACGQRAGNRWFSLFQVPQIVKFVVREWALECGDSREKFWYLGTVNITLGCRRSRLPRWKVMMVVAHFLLCPCKG